MNKIELISAFAASNQISKKQATIMLNNFLDIIANTLSQNEEIKIIGFGIFRVAKIKSKTIINPQSKEKMTTKECCTVRFIPGQTLKDTVNKK